MSLHRLCELSAQRSPRIKLKLTGHRHPLRGGRFTLPPLKTGTVPGTIAPKDIVPKDMPSDGSLRGDHRRHCLACALAERAIFTLPCISDAPTPQMCIRRMEPLTKRLTQKIFRARLSYFCVQTGRSVSSMLRAFAYSNSAVLAASQRSALEYSCVDITAPWTAPPRKLTTIRTWTIICLHCRMRRGRSRMLEKLRREALADLDLSQDSARRSEGATRCLLIGEAEHHSEAAGRGRGQRSTGRPERPERQIKPPRARGRLSSRPALFSLNVACWALFRT